MKLSRHRPPYLVAVLIAFLGGLTTHFAAKHLPRFVAEHVPDTLWALWVYLGIVYLAPRLSLWRAIGYALAFSYAIETSQLYHAPWLDSIRATLLGKLILGDTFSWSDLGCYTIGIAGGAWLDVMLQARPQRHAANHTLKANQPLP